MVLTLSGHSMLSNPALALRSSDSLSYSWLDRLWHRSHRNRSWSRLSVAERGMFRCGLWVAKARGKISSMRLMVHVLRIALKLLETHSSRIVTAGRRRAQRMFEEYAKPGGVFSWAPYVRQWLNDPGYIRYLGVLEVNH